MNYKYYRISRKKYMWWQGDLTKTMCIGVYERQGFIKLWAKSCIPQLKKRWQNYHIEIHSFIHITSNPLNMVFLQSYQKKINYSLIWCRSTAEQTISLRFMVTLLKSSLMPVLDGVPPIYSIMSCCCVFIVLSNSSLSHFQFILFLINF